MFDFVISRSLINKVCSTFIKKSGPDFVYSSIAMMKRYGPTVKEWNEWAIQQNGILELNKVGYMALNSVGGMTDKFIKSYSNLYLKTK